MIKITDDAWAYSTRLWESCHELQICDFLDSRWKYYICECIFTTFHKTMYTASIILYLFLLLLDCESNAITNFSSWCLENLYFLQNILIKLWELSPYPSCQLWFYHFSKRKDRQNTRKNIHQVHQCRTSISPHRNNRFLMADLLFCWLFLEMLRLVWVPTT